MMGWTARNWFPRLPMAASGGFARAVGVLMLGTLIAQVLNLLALPVLSRLYTPDEFTVLAVFMAVTVIVSVGANAGLDLAIPLARRGRHGVLLSWAGGSIALGVATVVWLGAILLPADIRALLVGAELAGWAPALLGAVCFTAAASMNLEALFIARRRFTTVAVTRLIQALVGAGLQIGLSFVGWRAGGLILGYAAMTSTVFVVLALLTLRSHRGPPPGVRLLWRTVRHYGRFPRYSAVEVVTNAASVYLPLVLISFLSSGAEAAYLMLGMRMLQAPMLLVGRAVQQAVQSRAGEWARAGRLGENAGAVLRQVLSLTLGGALFATLTLPFLSGTLLGPRWVAAGWILAALIPNFQLYLLSYVLVPALYAAARNRLLLGITTAGLIVRNLAVVVGAEWGGAAAAYSYAGVGAAYYAVVVVLSARACGVRLRAALWPNSLGAILLLAAIPLAGAAILLLRH